jgi:hypothetical protein
MTETMALTIGSCVSCIDGPCGVLTRLVIDPLKRTLTHLVVDPKRHEELGRLVPIAKVTSSTGGVRLLCTKAEFEHLGSARATDFIPGNDSYTGYRREEMLTFPHYGLGSGNGLFVGGMGHGMQGESSGAHYPSQTVTYDAVPLGEVEVRRGDHVHATDGNIGRVEGLIIDPENDGVTHLLLQEGHLWGRKEVAIPITAVTDVSAGIKLRLCKSEVEALPPVDFGHPDSRTQ